LFQVARFRIGNKVCGLLGHVHNHSFQIDIHPIGGWPFMTISLSRRKNPGTTPMGSIILNESVASDQSVPIFIVGTDQICEDPSGDQSIPITQ
jgi:hypothetical protein